MLDPFCGTGTTLVECKKLGIESVGIEPNPMAHFASRVKADWSGDGPALLAHARNTAEGALSRLRDEGLDDEPVPPLFQNCRMKCPQSRTIPEEISDPILPNSMSPLPFHKTCTLLDVVIGQEDEQSPRHEKLALARAVLSGISNIEFGPKAGSKGNKRSRNRRENISL